MFKLDNKKLFWNDRPIYVRDLIITEDILQQINFDEDEKMFSKMVVVNGMLIFIMKYKEGPLANLWHFAFQSISKDYLYESYALYLGN